MGYGELFREIENFPAHLFTIHPFFRLMLRLPTSSSTRWHSFPIFHWTTSLIHRGFAFCVLRRCLCAVVLVHLLRTTLSIAVVMYLWGFGNNSKLVVQGDQIRRQLVLLVRISGCPLLEFELKQSHWNAWCPSFNFKWTNMVLKVRRLNAVTSESLYLVSAAIKKSYIVAS